MKKLITFLVLILNQTAFAQNDTPEKTIFGLQTGFAGVWLHNETRLVSGLVLRTEVGLEHDFTVGDHYDHAGFILQPVLTLEPRFYYNLKKRNAKGKPTSQNSGNYISLKTSYHPDWFVINLDDAITKTADLSIVPTWGMRRQLGKHFTYEAGAGLGLRIVQLKANYYDGNAQNLDGFATNRNQYMPYLHLRIGYAF